LRLARLVARLLSKKMILGPKRFPWQVCRRGRLLGKVIIHIGIVELLAIASSVKGFDKDISVLSAGMKEALVNLWNLIHVYRTNSTVPVPF